jgi:hypothetical protein
LLREALLLCHLQNRLDLPRKARLSCTVRLRYHEDGSASIQILQKGQIVSNSRSFLFFDSPTAVPRCRDRRGGLKTRGACLLGLLQFLPDFCTYINLLKLTFTARHLVTALPRPPNPLLRPVFCIRSMYHSSPLSTRTASSTLSTPTSSPRRRRGPSSPSNRRSHPYPRSKRHSRPAHPPTKGIASDEDRQEPESDDPDDPANSDAMGKAKRYLVELIKSGCMGSFDCETKTVVRVR